MKTKKKRAAKKAVKKAMDKALTREHLRADVKQWHDRFTIGHPARSGSMDLTDQDRVEIHELLSRLLRWL